MNEHLYTMKKAIQDYQTAIDKAREKIAFHEKYFTPEMAAKEINKIRDGLEKDKAQAEAKIRQAQDAGKAKVRAWGKLDGDKITSDAKLLDYGVTPEQFSELVGRYESNGTMLTLLKNYAEKKNTGRGKDDPYFDASGIPSVQEREHAYDAFAHDAMGLVDNLSKEDTFGQGAGSPMMQTAVERFGEETAFNTALYNLL